MQLCSSARPLWEVLPELSSAARRALGVRTLVLSLDERGLVQSGTSGSDQHRLATWVEQTLRVERGRPVDDTAREDLLGRAPSGTAIAPIAREGQLQGLLAARGFRARDPRARVDHVLQLVTQTIELSLAAHHSQRQLRWEESVKRALAAGLGYAIEHARAEVTLGALLAALQKVVSITHLGLRAATADGVVRRAVTWEPSREIRDWDCATLALLEDQAWTSQEAIWSPDVARDADELLRSLSEHDIASVMVLPLADPRDAAVVTVATNRRDAYSAAERALLIEVLSPYTPLGVRLAAATSSDSDLAQRVKRSERLASIGQLAAGVAHEVNNPLNVILSNLQALSEKASFLHGDREFAEILGESLDAVRRIAGTVDDLRVYARLGEGVTELDINEVVRTAVRIARSALPHRGRLQVKLAPLPVIRGDHAKLAQMLTRLITLASEVRDAHASSQNVLVRTTQEGDFVRVMIQSSRARDERESGFEPRVAARDEQELALGDARDAAERHGGRVEVAEQAAGEHRISVLLPIAAGASLRHTTMPPSNLRSSFRARVLLIDDEPAVLRALQRVLRRKHEVMTVPGGAEALELLRRDPHFDVILCDVMMPDVDGVAVYETLLETSPGLERRVVFCTGGEFTRRAKALLARVPNQVLLKPVDSAVLLDAIARVQDANQTMLPGQYSG